MSDSPSRPFGEEQQDFGDLAESDVESSLLPLIAANEKLTPNQVLAGRYVLSEQLKSLGGAVVWKATDQVLSRAVVLYLLDDADPETKKVLQAGRSAALATDSRFVRVLDVIGLPEVGCSMIVSEFAPGVTLADLFYAGQISAVEGAWIVRELAEGLSGEHEKGLFHLRLSPEQVLITHSGAVKIAGLVIDSALTKLAGDDVLTPSQREAVDVRDLGKLLYAATVSRWPAEPTDRGQSKWGMLIAPKDQLGWLTPRQINPGVSPALDVICDQVLSNEPRHNAVPITSCIGLSRALSRVLGMVDASADLEEKVKAAANNMGEESASASQASAVGPSAIAKPLVDQNGQGPGFFVSASRPTPDGGHSQDEKVATDSIASSAISTGQSNPPDLVGPQFVPADGTEVGSKKIPPKPIRPSNNRRWLGVLLFFVGLVLVISLIWSAVLRNKSDAERAESNGLGKPVTVVRAIDFDPQQDGGNNEENTQMAGLAFDGDPATGWQTELYHNDPKLGKLKPGVGLIFDLGEVKNIVSLQISFLGSPTSFSVFSPAGDAASADEPPRNTISEWTQIDSQSTSETTTRLHLESPISTRYVLVYLTELPQVNQARYQGGIAEVVVGEKK